MTAEGKITTADIVRWYRRGTVAVLVTDDPTGASPTSANAVKAWYPARNRRGMTRATVTGFATVEGGKIRRYDLTTDVGTITGIVGSQTFWLAAPAPTRIPAVAQLKLLSGPHAPLTTVTRCDVGGEPLTGAWWLVQCARQGWTSDTGASCAAHSGNDEPPARAVLQPCPTGYGAAVEAIAERAVRPVPADPMEQWAEIHTDAYYRTDGPDRIGRVYETVHGLGADHTGADLDRARNADGRSAEELCQAYIDAWHAQDHQPAPAPTPFVSDWSTRLSRTPECINNAGPYGRKFYDVPFGGQSPLQQEETTAHLVGRTIIGQKPHGGGEVHMRVIDNSGGRLTGVLVPSGQPVSVYALDFVIIRFSDDDKDQ